MKNRLKSYGPYLVFLAAMLWASDAPFRIALTETLPSDLIVFIEHSIGVFILLPILFLYHKELHRITVQHWIAVIVIGVGGSALALLAFTESFNYMNPSVSILLQKLQPLIAIGLAVGLLREQTSKRFWLFALVALFGAYLISFPNLIPQLYEGEVFNPHIIGVLLALTAAVLWGASTVLGRYMLNTISFKMMTAIRFLVAFLFLFVLTGVNGSWEYFVDITSTDLFYLFVISITSGVVAMAIYYKGLSHSRASVATIAELGFPVAAVGVNYFFLDTLLTFGQLVGMAVLIYAVFQLGKVNKSE